MTRVIALGSVDEAQDVAEEWGRLHAGGSSDIFTSPAWCLASWRAFPDLGTPLLLIAPAHQRPARPELAGQPAGRRA